MYKSWLFAAAAVIAVGLPALANAGSLSDPTRSQHAQTPTSVPPIKVKNVAISYGTGGTTLASGFNNLDSGTTLSCPANTCTIAAADMVQLIAGTNGSLWAICVVVDGTYANPGCPYQGAATSANYQVGNSQQNLVVGSGNHTVQTQVYVASTSTLGEWQVTYTLYKGS
ncbi:MAG TPA: hypothetical protein VKR31_10690 [Rhizomicrobium sp.]|nr:hypothetical protein [Rhizomicrobium sp.]